MQHLGVTQILRIYTVMVQGKQTAGCTGGFVNILNFALTGFFHTETLVPT